MTDDPRAILNELLVTLANIERVMAPNRRLPGAAYRVDLIPPPPLPQTPLPPDAQRPPPAPRGIDPWRNRQTPPSARKPPPPVPWVEPPRTERPNEPPRDPQDGPREPRPQAPTPSPSPRAAPPDARPPSDAPPRRTAGALPPSPPDRLPIAQGEPPPAVDRISRPLLGQPELPGAERRLRAEPPDIQQQRAAETPATAVPPTFGATAVLPTAPPPSPFERTSEGAFTQPPRPAAQSDEVWADHRLRSADGPRPAEGPRAAAVPEEMEPDSAVADEAVAPGRASRRRRFRRPIVRGGRIAVLSNRQAAALERWLAITFTDRAVGRL